MKLLFLLSRHWTWNIKLGLISAPVWTVQLSVFVSAVGLQIHNVSVTQTQGWQYVQSSNFVEHWMSHIATRCRIHRLRHRRAAAASLSARDARGFITRPSPVESFSRCAPSVSFSRPVFPLKVSPRVLHFVLWLARVLFFPSYHPVLLRPVKSRMRWVGCVVRIGEREA